MVNYFRDFIPSLSSYLGPLSDFTKKTNEMTEKAISAFKFVNDQVAHYTSRFLMNASDPLILHTNASTKAKGGVLMQVQGGREKPCVFVSHIDFQTKQPGGGDGAGTLRFRFLREESCSYLLGKLFTVKTSHKNLADSTVPKLVRGRVLLSEFRFQKEHIPGAQNVVTNGLTRIFQLDYEKLPEKIKHWFKEDTT